MNLTFSICDIGNKKIRIQDFTQDGEEYIPENLPESTYIVRYFNYRYKDKSELEKNNFGLRK